MPSAEPASTGDTPASGSDSAAYSAVPAGEPVNSDQVVLDHAVVDVITMGESSVTRRLTDASNLTLLGVFGEVPRLGQRQEHPQRVRAVLPVLQHDLLADLFLGQGQQFDDDLGSFAVPGQAHGADPELRVDRSGEGQLAAGQHPGRCLDLRAEPPRNLGDQRAQPVGQHRHLLFLAGNREHPAAVDDLQKEFAFAWLPDGSGEESVG